RAPASAPASAPVAVAAAVPSPPAAARRTTRGDLAAGNLDAQIVGLEHAAAAPSHELGHTLGLAQLLGARGNFFGRGVDLERADRLAEAAVAGAPHDPAALLARAATRAALHRFSDARADLDAAAAAGANAGRVAHARAMIDVALGRVELALPV